MNFRRAEQLFLQAAMQSVGADSRSLHKRDAAGVIRLEQPACGDASSTLLVSNGVLQYLDESAIDAELQRLAGRSAFAVFRIHTRFSSDPLIEGRNVFASVHDQHWWAARIARVFGAASALAGTPREFTIILSWEASPALLHQADRLRQALLRHRHRARRIERLRGTLWRCWQPPLRESRLLAELAGRHVALVGNARSLDDAGHGQAIDAADVVVRCNRGILLSERSHGSRTDWICTGLAVSRRYAERRGLQRIVWASRRPKMMRNIPAWMYASGRLHVFSEARDAALKRGLGRVASTGMKAIDLLAASGCRQLDIFGFDFGATDSASQPTRPMSDDHDFEAERRLALEMIALDDRIHLHE